MDHRKQQQNPSPRGGGAASGKHGKVGKGGKGCGGAGAGGKKPIKVVYISNPMRVKTSAAGFRALVQELTGRHADPSKYSADGFDDDDGGSAQELSPEGSAAASTPDGAGAGPGHHAGTVAAWDQRDVAAAAFGADEEGDGEEDIFRSQLLDNDYSVFSPPTLLYDYPHSNKV